MYRRVTLCHSALTGTTTFYDASNRKRSVAIPAPGVVQSIQIFIMRIKMTCYLGAPNGFVLELVSWVGGWVGG